VLESKFYAPDIVKILMRGQTVTVKKRDNNSCKVTVHVFVIEQF